LVIEDPARPEWKLSDDSPKPEEKAAGLYRFRLNVASKETARIVVNESKPLYVEYVSRAGGRSRETTIMESRSLPPVSTEKILERGKWLRYGPDARSRFQTMQAS
jgi:hypothetical protein